MSSDGLSTGNDPGHQLVTNGPFRFTNTLTSGLLPVGPPDQQATNTEGPLHGHPPAVYLRFVFRLKLSSELNHLILELKLIEDRVGGL